MPLARRPHTAAWRAKSATVSSSEITGYTEASPVSLLGQMTEKTTSQAFEMFGMEVDFPAVWLCNVGSGVKVGDSLTVNSRRYEVVAGPQVMDAEPITAHERFLCRRNA